MTAQNKTIFIAHPIGGGVEGKVEHVLEICERIHLKTIIPVAPYLVSLQYLKDEVVEDRQLGVEANLECFQRGYIDELWLFGDKISSGMKEEIRLARELNIPIIPQTEGTKRDLAKMIQ